MTKRINIELIFWIGGLTWLAFMNPSETHFSLCPIKNLGFSFCPGCGLGHSISYLFHGQLQESLHHHPLGIFALGVILWRIYQLIRNNTFQNIKKVIYLSTVCREPFTVNQINQNHEHNSNDDAFES